jgi:SAM-dependent methyltransferase
MDARLQRRVQRYGWDLASADYESLWQTQLASVQASLLDCAALRPGERVLDVACGTGLVSFAAARAVGQAGGVCGVDLSGQMVDAARARAAALGLGQAEFLRMDAESLDCADASFDVALCSLGLMYLPEPERALRELARVLRPGGRLVLAVWGERARCGWAGVFPIVEAETVSDVCPLFFRLGQPGTLERLCADAGLVVDASQRMASELDYVNGDEACDAAFVGGPVALAWSRFDEGTRLRVRERYVESIAGWRSGDGYRLPAEFVVVAATRPR